MGFFEGFVKLDGCGYCARWKNQLPKQDVFLLEYFWMTSWGLFRLGNKLMIKENGRNLKGEVWVYDETYC